MKIAGRDVVCEETEQQKRIVILSPHSDDAVWSLGGAIAVWSNHAEILVITVFDGDPPAVAAARSREPKHRWRNLRGMTQRRIEDKRVAATLGIQSIGLGEVEAAFRIDQSGNFICRNPEALFMSDNPALSEHGHFTQIAAKLRAALHHDDLVVAPIGFGGHIDHVLVHEIARDLSQTCAFYAEFPYFGPDQTENLALHLARLGLSNLGETIAGDWHSWITAASQYRSQVLRMFGSQRHFCASLSRYARVCSAEPLCRIWAIRER